MIDQRKLEEMVWDMTIGAGEGDMSTTVLVQKIEMVTGQKLNRVQERIVQRANHECQMKMEMP